MDNITWTQIDETHWRTNALDNGLYGHVFKDKGSDGVDEYWAHTYDEDGNLPAGPHETGEVWTELEDAKKDAGTHLAMEWADAPSI